MRMTQRIRNDEGGAVLVIVALGLVVILGMLALTLDLGRAVTVKRDMVNAADAAALAGAQQCAMGAGTGAAEAAALETAMLNGAESTVLFDADAECDDPVALGPKTVAVKYSKDMDYYVAPILGFDGVTITAEATAIWGPAGRTRPVPFVAEQGAFQGPCNIPNVPEGTLCPLWFDNNDFEASTFGTLNLKMWDVDENANCANKELNANTHYASVGGYDGQIPLHSLNYPDPTWVCAGTGNAQKIFDALWAQAGEILAFPVTAGCVRQGGHCEVFNVVGFARLKFNGVFKRQDAPPECGVRPTNASTHCMLTEWVGGGFGNDSGVIGGLDFGLRAIRLVK